MKFKWLLLSFLSVFLLCSPAEAGRLLFWRFDSNQNQLQFTTDEGVQPRAQLIPNPTRLVIDLPGTKLGRPKINQPIGGLIKEVRVGQFDAFTTRLVVEIEPGYTIDPQKVRVRGSSPTQWFVNIPTPQPIESLPSNPPPPNNQNNNQNNNQTTSGQNNLASDFRITNNGLFVRLKGEEGSKIRIKRSRNRRRIDFEIQGAILPSSLAQRTLPINRYGVSEIEFSQTSTAPNLVRITLNVSKDSPDWQASFSRFGGLVLLPKGRINESNRGSSSQVPSRNVNTRPSNGKATIEALELANNNSQLLIRANGTLRATSSWNRAAGIYEIRIANARLAEQVRGPQLATDSPVSRLRIRQDDAQTVVIQVQPANGVQIERLNQASDKLLILQLRRLRAVLPNSTSIPVPPPPRRRPSPRASIPVPAPPRRAPSPRRPRVPNGRTLVVIDPGHGGKDPGTIGIAGVQEKNVILPISQQVAQILRQKGILVKMTRNRDYFVSLQARSQMANRSGANLFVSIHANAINLSRPDVNGVETYYYESGRTLAQIIHRNILRRVNVNDRRVRRARFYVLRKTSMPAVLVEVGFLTGRDDAAKLANPTYRRQMAGAIASGILEYIQRYRR